MTEIKRYEGRPVIDYMARDYDSLLRSMRQLIPYKMPEWTDFESEADLGNVLLQLFAHMGDVLSYYQDRVANESFLGTARTRRSIIHHLRLIGYRLSTAAPASAELELMVPANTSVTLRRGDAFATKSRKDAPSVRFEYNGEHDLEITSGNDPVSKMIPVEEGRLVRDELLGTSDGKPDQSFPLAHAGLILRSRAQDIHRDVILTTTFLGRPPTDWTLHETLAFSGKDQTHFIIEIDEDDQATVRFGDGTFGAVPLAGSEVRATYRVGGGLHGNVPADTIKTFADASQLVLVNARITNPKPATGGAERETLEHAVEHAPAVFRSLRRAVTADDYKALALDFAGVGKVRAVATNWNTVTLYVAPAAGGLVSDVLEANLLAYFEDKRMVTTTIEIEDVTYVPIYVTAVIGVVSYYTPEAVREQVRSAAGDLLAFDNVDFGRPVYLSKFYEAIEHVDGVEYVTVTEFRRGDPESELDSEGKIESDGIILIEVDEIPVAPDDPAYQGGIRVLFEEEVGPS